MNWGSVWESFLYLIDVPSLKPPEFTKKIQRWHVHTAKDKAFIFLFGYIFRADTILHMCQTCLRRSSVRMWSTPNTLRRYFSMAASLSAPGLSGLVASRASISLSSDLWMSCQQTHTPASVTCFSQTYVQCCCWVYSQYEFLNKWLVLLFSKDAVCWSKVTVKLFIMHFYIKWMLFFWILHSSKNQHW